jgi:hypothetical protein
MARHVLSIGRVTKRISLAWPLLKGAPTQSSNSRHLQIQSGLQIHPSTLDRASMLIPRWMPLTAGKIRNTFLKHLQSFALQEFSL